MGSLSETLFVKQSGEAIVTTLSPFLGESSENSIGSFKVKLSGDVMAKLKGLVATTQASVHGEDIFPPETTVLRLKSGRSAIRWIADENTPSQQWQVLYQEIRKEGLKHPAAALRLRCESEEGSFLCVYRNIGDEKVTVIDPLSVPGSLSCLLEGGIPRSVSGQKENSLKRPYGLVTLAPHASHSFQIVTKDRCVTRLRVDTSKVRFDSSYQGVLVGELISNDLK